MKAKKKLTQRVQEQDDRPDLTPLIDVIFMLLLFFIITTTFAADTFFPISLPKATRASVRTLKDSLVVEINASGEFALDKKFVASETRLYEQLAKAKTEGALRTVVIKADEKCPAKHLVAVLDILRGLDINEFAVTAQRDRGL
ncbi:MAG: biopolymer transporter ExbD [Planctomycetota bacterium]|nr:biopolymer transporter ExbD [Planctomycetota bacterium]MDA1142928.1 biopolymer transporter ExbD [Planctomycetota bacterium]